MSSSDYLVEYKWGSVTEELIEVIKDTGNFNSLPNPTKQLTIPIYSATVPNIETAVK